MKRFLALLLSVMLILSTFVITASAAGVINYNFNELEDGEYTLADITTKYGATFKSDSSFSASAEDGMLTLESKNATADNVLFTLDQEYTTGIMELKSRFRIDEVTYASGANDYSFFTFDAVDADGKRVELLRFFKNAFARPQGNSADHGSIGPSLTKDSDGFYNINIVITSDVPEEYQDKNYYVTVNDMNAGGAKKSSHTVTVLTGIQSLRYHIEKNSASKANSTKLTFDSLSFKEFAPEVISVSSPSGNISPRIGVINLSFNTEVDPATIATGINFEKVNGGEIAGLAIAPTADNKGATISFDTLDADDYVLSVTSELHALADGASFTPFTANYTAVVDPFALVSVSNEGGTVMPSIGKIDIAFNNPIIDEENLLSSISFTKKNDDESVPVGAVVRFGETADKVEVLVGRVAKGEYALTINNTLKDINGDTLDEPVTYGYIIEEDNPAMVDVSFDGIEERAYTYGEIEAMADGRFSASSMFEVTGVDGGLEFREPAGSANSTYTIMNTETFKTGKISYNFVLKKVPLDSAGDNQFRINAKTSEGKTHMITASLTNTGFNRPTGINGWYSGDSVTLSANEDGYFDFTVVFTDDIPASRKTDKTTYIMYVYDNVKGSSDPVFTQVYLSSNLIDIAGISLNTYRNTEGKGYDNAVVVKSINGLLDLESIPNNVMNSNAEAVNPSEANLSFIFTNAFKNITADGISLLFGDEIVQVDTVVSEEEKMVVLTPIDYLGYGKTYTVTYPAPLQTYEFTTEDYADRLSATTNGLLLEVGVVNPELDEYVIVATYKDAEGNKISVDSDTTSTTNATIQIPAEAESVVVDAYKVVDGCYIKASLPVERSL